jgi:PadR family transcriptional regulator PadR
MQRRRRWRYRTRRRSAAGEWDVRARVERFGEAALLVLLAERPTHGYELLERLPQLLGEDRVDVGNLYRVLRALEEEGIVTSQWSADLPGPAKRTYALTDDGRTLLAAWLSALDGLRGEVSEFLDRAHSSDIEKGGEHVRT